MAQTLHDYWMSRFRYLWAVRHLGPFPHAHDEELRSLIGKIRKARYCAGLARGVRYASF